MFVTYSVRELNAILFLKENKMAFAAFSLFITFN
jgi:hypothetical protein